MPSTPAQRARRLWSRMVRRARQMAELHLKPEPNAICHTRSPRLMRSCVSLNESSYQIDDDDLHGSDQKGPLG